MRLLLRQNEILLDSGGRLHWLDPDVVFIAASSPGSSLPVRFEVHEDRICLYKVPGRRDDWYCLWFSRHRDGTVHKRAGLSEQAWCRLARRPCEGRGQPAPTRPPWTRVTLRPIGPDAS